MSRPSVITSNPPASPVVSERARMPCCLVRDDSILSIVSGSSVNSIAGTMNGREKRPIMAAHIDSPDAAERRTVAGLFPDRASAVQAIDALQAAGFTGDQIGVALHDCTAQGVLLEETGAQVAAEAATTEALGGGLLGGLTGLLTGIGALVIPGLGPVVAGGMLATAFGVAGGHGGGRRWNRCGGWGDSSAPKPASGFPNRRHVTSRPGSGPGVLVAVEAGARMLEAMAILDRYGADTGPATGPGAIGG
jgi:hypothetical protein